MVPNRARHYIYNIYMTWLSKLLMIFLLLNERYDPGGNYMFKVNDRNIRTRCEICSKSTLKTPERR